MIWPALYGGFPLMYPDSAWYVLAGRRIAAAVLLNHRSAYYGNRSAIYSLGIFPLHMDHVLWPIIVFQSVLTAWVLWLVVRCISAEKLFSRFVVLMILLSLLSSLSWYGSFVMPDILGPDLYLCIFLLVFTAERISHAERWVLSGIAWWAMASHATHLLIAFALCGSLVIVALFQPAPRLKYVRITVQLAAIFAFAVGAQILLNVRLYGTPSLQGDHPPFLTARIIIDGPGRTYLENNCAEMKWEMCRYRDNLSGTSDRFLWSPDGVWSNAPKSSQSLIRSQDGAFAAAVLRAYPREELLNSAASFLQQLYVFDLEGFGLSSLGEIHKAVPQFEQSYLASRHARDELPLHTFTWIHRGAVVVSLVGIVAFFPWLRRARPTLLTPLGSVIAVCVVANAFVTGTISSVNGRYGSRVMWLIPFFALLCIVTRTRSSSPQTDQSA